MLARSARLLSAPARSVRRFSLPAFSQEDDSDYMIFPEEGPGVNYNLNWSLADDLVTPSKEAYRNASLQELLMFAKGTVSKDKVLTSTAPATADAPLFSTDNFPGLKPMDIDEFDVQFEEVRDELYKSDRLFVEDAAVGSTRASEIRVRVISNDAVPALYFRNILLRTPLYDPEAFPRVITVYVSSTPNPKPFTVSDYNPTTNKAVVVASGAVPLAAIQQQITHVAAQLMDKGGYRHIKGGGVRVDIGRKEGNIEWYLDDRHYFPPADEAHPDLLAIKGSVVIGGEGKVKVIVGGGPTVPVLPSLFAASGLVWEAAGISKLYAGVSAPVAGTRLPKGALVAQGAATLAVPLTASLATAPDSIVAIGTGAPDLNTLLGLTESQAKKLDDRIKAGNVKVKTAATFDEAINA